MPTAPKVACRKCGVTIAKTSRKRHEDGCGKDEQRFSCPHCDQKFKTKQNVKVHVKAKHSSETHPCSKCDQVFDSEMKLLFHFNKDHTMKTTCICGDSFASVQNLKHHIKRMAEKGDIGLHEQVEKKAAVEPEATDTKATSKRKADAMDPLDAFFDAVSDVINRPDPTNPLCRSASLCTTTRLSHGFPGGKKEYCSNHRNEVPGLVELYGLCKYVGCSKRAHDFVVTPTMQLNFCAECRKILIQRGLPDPDANIKRAKNYNKVCIEEGCVKRATFDEHKHCVLHSFTKKSDDKRACEIPGCETRPSVGYPGLPQRRCGKHKELGMIAHALCFEEGCNTRASFGPPEGKKSSCGRHRKDGYVLLGTTICAMACCSTSANGLQAVFFHPDHQDETSEFFNKRVCRFGRRVLIEDALMHNDTSRLEFLMNHFNMNRVLTLNAQSAFRFSCESIFYPDLTDCVDIVFDGAVTGGPKTIGALRPDIFYKWCIDGVNYGIHIEYDETMSHEDDPDRLKCIAKQADCEDRVYVIRVYGGHDAKDPVCTRVNMGNFEYYQVTHAGEKVAMIVAEAVEERIGWIHEGLGPCERESRPAIVRF